MKEQSKKMTIRIVGVLLQYLEITTSLSVLPISFQSYPTEIKIKEHSPPLKITTNLIVDLQISIHLFTLCVL